MLKNCMVVLGLATSHHDSKMAGTIAQQLGWVFVGPCHPSAHGPPAKLRSFTSLQMVHTHAPQQRGFLRLRQVRWRWRWKGHGNEMTLEMRWQLLNRDTRRGTQKRRGKRETPTPTHLAQSGQTRKETRKGQGKRKSGRTTGQTPTKGGGADRSTPAKGGGRTEAPDTTYKARAVNNMVRFLLHMWPTCWKHPEARMSACDSGGDFHSLRQCRRCWKVFEIFNSVASRAI